MKELVELRLTELLSENENEKIKWEDVFDETQQMTGKQEKYNYITDRTFLRPRDIIQFCNETLNVHKINSSEEDKINNDDIYKAKDEYGNYLLNELDDEIHKHILNYELLLEILKSIGYYQFDLEDFKFASKTKNYSALSETTEVDSLKDLFEFSILGYYRAGGSGFGGSEYVFKYKDLNARFDENARTFRVHPGLIEVLRLKRTTKPKP